MQSIISSKNPGKRCRFQQKAADAPNTFQEVPADWPQQPLDVSGMLTLGWRAKTDLREGIARTCAWFLGQADMRQ